MGYCETVFNYLFNQSDKDFTGKYIKLHSSEQNLPLLISRRLGLPKTYNLLSLNTELFPYLFLVALITYITILNH